MGRPRIRAHEPDSLTRHLGVAPSIEENGHGDLRPDELQEPAFERELPLPRRLPGRSTARHQYARLYVLMAATDILSLAVALFLADLIRFGLAAPSEGVLAVIALSPLLALPIFGAFRLYSSHQLAPAEEFRRVILAVTVTVTSLFTISFWSSLALSRLWIGFAWALSILLALAARRLWHWYTWRARGRGDLTFRTLIVGANQEATRLAEVMRSDRLGFQPIGFVAVRGEGLRPKRAAASPGQRDGDGHVPVLGLSGDVRHITRQSGAECLFVASSVMSVDEMTEISKTARLEGLELRVTSCLPEVLSNRLTVQPLGGVMALSLKPATLTPPQALAKRAFDLAVSTGIAVLTLPLWALIALAVKVTSPGPVLYRQDRVGLRGRPFTVLKFRTMVPGADGMVDGLKPNNEADGPLFKIRNDPRVTRIGRWLRRWSLDELPQLINVVKGEMSLVGPRPPLPEEVAQYEDWHFERLEVLPGITGLWQVKGRSDVSFNEYVRLDLFYIENWSLAYDLYIIFRTFKAVLSRNGAY